MSGEPVSSDFTEILEMSINQLFLIHRLSLTRQLCFAQVRATEITTR